MSGRPPSALEPAAQDPAAAALAVAGPLVATVPALGLGFFLGVPPIPGVLALHACVLSILVSYPALLVLSREPAASRRLLQGPFIAATLMGALAAWWTAIPLALAVPALALAQVLVLAWLALPSLTAASDAWVIACIPVLGPVIALGCGVWGRATGGDPGMLWGFAAGAGLVSLLLHLRLRRRGVVGTPPPAIDGRLPVIGGALATGLCWDLLLSLHGPAGQPVLGRLGWAGGGECILIAHLGAIPILIIACLRCVRAFHQGTLRFTATILGGGHLAAIMGAKQELISSLDRELALVVRLQALVALALILCAPPLAQALGLPGSCLPRLCLEILGAAVLVPLLAVMTLLLAGGWRRELMLTALAFSAVSLSAAVPGLVWSGIPAGWGRLLGGLAALVLGLSALRRQVTDLEYQTLSREPLRA